MKSNKTLKKLFFINTIFPEITGNDLYYAEQIRNAVERILEREAESPPKDPRKDFDRFRRAVLRLRETLPAAGGGFAHWDAGANPAGFSPLWARAELIRVLKELAAEPNATLLVTNLAETIRPRHGRWTPATRAEYGEAVGLVRELARRWSRPSGRLTLIVY